MLNKHPKQPDPVQHFWKLLSDADAFDTAKRTICDYDEKGKFFTVPVLGDTFRVFAEEQKVLMLSGTSWSSVGYREMGFEFFLVLLGYLTAAKAIPLRGEWVSASDLNGGGAFFRGPHVPLIQPFVSKFESNIEAFRKVADTLSAPVSEKRIGDISAVFDAFPRIPLQYVLWQKDEEFRGRGQILFDRSIEEHFALDLVWALTRFCTKRIISC